VQLVSGVTSKFYTTQVTLTEGKNFTFYVQARNAVGFSASSSTVKILAAQKPDKPLNVATTIVSNGVAVSWTAQARGSVITAYSV